MEMTKRPRKKAEEQANPLLDPVQCLKQGEAAMTPVP
jgi:hypothetical protein